MSNTKVINYSSMRNSTTVNCGLPKSPLGDRILRHTSLNQQSSVKNTVKLRMAESHRIPPIKMPSNGNINAAPKAVITPRLGRRTNENSTTFAASNNGNATVAKNLSPLQSPQLIRSTRIETNNWINNNNNNNTTSNINGNKIKSSCSIHSKSPGSGTSVESIVPKYQQQSLGINCTLTGSQKRSYNFNKTTTTNKLTNRIVNTRNNNNHVQSCINGILSSSAAAPARNGTGTAILNGNLMSGSKKMSSTIMASTQTTNATSLTTKKLIKSNISTSSNTSSSSSSKSFSAKFPNGLPFEDEFYHYRNLNGSSANGALRTNNHHHHQNGHHNGNNRSSVASDTSFSNNSSHSDESAVTENTVRSSYSSYEDEFTRKPSNEPLYVDFTLKSIDKLKSATNGMKKSSIQPTSAMAVKTTYKLSTNDNCFCEFETIKSSSTGGGAYGKANKLIGNHQQHKVNGISSATKQQSDSDVVYVAVASWVPKCNRLPYETTTTNGSILEPTNETNE